MYIAVMTLVMPRE